MAENPTATIVICVHNRAGRIGACLRSLAALEARDFEIVLVDDASTDATPERLEEFRRAHPRIPVKIARNARNLGVSGARNVGIDAADGEFILFTDSDCTVAPNWLTEMLAALTAEPDVSAAAGAVVDPAPRNWAERAYFGTSRIGPNRRQHRRLVGNNMGFRVEALRAHMFDPAMNYYCDEDDLALRMRADGHRFAFAPEAVVYHDHPVTLRGYMKMALRQGVGSARLWYKHNLWLGRDLWPLAAALATLPLGIFDARLWMLPALCGLLQVAALLYNETQFKGKSRLRALQVLPVCLIYYACRAYAVGRTLLAIFLGGEQPVRRSKRLWRERRASAPSIQTRTPRRTAA